MANWSQEFPGDEGPYWVQWPDEVEPKLVIVYCETDGAMWVLADTENEPITEYIDSEAWWFPVAHPPALEKGSG